MLGECCGVGGGRRLPQDLPVLPTQRMDSENNARSVSDVSQQIDAGLARVDLLVVYFNDQVAGSDSKRFPEAFGFDPEKLHTEHGALLVGRPNLRIFNEA